MALLLAFDTATKHLAVCLTEGGQVLASRADESDRFSHAEKLNVFIDEVMNEAGRALQDLDAVAVGIGPGSYTGLRIGLSAAKGLCFALDKPLIGMSTLEVLTYQLRSIGAQVDDTDVLMPMIDARRMEVFTSSLPAASMDVPVPHALVLDEAGMSLFTDRGRVWVFGDGADKAAALWPALNNVRHVVGVKPSVSGLAPCSEVAFKAGRIANTAYLVPDYVKDANVTQSKPS